MTTEALETLDCGHAPSQHESFTTGYGIVDGKKLCYECCADLDREQMKTQGRIDLYLTGSDKNGWEIINWPGSLKFIPTRVKRGHHNIARVRHDAWFKTDNEWWHGVQYGDNSQILRCRRIKS